MRGLEWFSVQSVRDDGLLVHRALNIPALVVVVVKRLKVHVTRSRIGTHESRQVAEGNSVPGFDRGPSFDAIVVDAIGNPRQTLQIIRAQPHRVRHQTRNLERPFATGGFVPHRDGRRDVVAGELVARFVRSRVYDIHRRMPEQLPLDDEILALGVLEKLVGRLRSARITRGEKSRGDDAGPTRDELSPIDSSDYTEDVVMPAAAHVAVPVGGAAVGGGVWRLGSRL